MANTTDFTVRINNSKNYKNNKNQRKSPRWTLAAAVCTMALLLVLAPTAQAASSFSDVPASHWAYQAISNAADKGIAAGYENGTFQPSGQVTYAQFAAFLARAFYGSPVNSNSSPWYKTYVDALDTDGILDGTAVAGKTSGSGMDRPINRYDMALMMYHIMAAQGNSQNSGNNNANSLSDWKSIPEKYADAVAACFGAGILSGMPDGSFSGGQPMNRAQACTVIARASGVDVGTQTDVCADVLNLINAERSKAGLSSLKTLDSLTKAAQMRSDDLSKGCFENRPDGSSWDSVFITAGVTKAVDIDYVDESVVGGTDSPAEVLAQIKSTPDALAALLTKEYTHAGIGYTHTENGYGGYQDFWSVLYILPSDSPSTPSPAAPTTPTTPATPSGTTNSFTPVPMAELANKKSLQKKATDEQLKQAYDKAVKLVTPYAGLSLEDQLMAVASEIRVMFESGMSYSMESAHYNDPYGYFIEGSASCAGCTRATGLCLNILGIPYEHVNENQYSHQWCRVNVNGTYWICDAYGLYCGPEPAPYQHPYL